MPIRRWFDWIKTQGWIATDPTRELELPKSEFRLPTSVLTVEQVIKFGGEQAAAYRCNASRTS